MGSTLRRLVPAAIVVACGIVGFVVGWSSREDGGLESYYGSGLIDLVGGLLLGLVLVAVRKAVIGRWHPPTVSKVAS